MHAMTFVLFPDYLILSYDHLMGFGQLVEALLQFMVRVTRARTAKGDSAKPSAAMDVVCYYN